MNIIKNIKKTSSSFPTPASKSLTRLFMGTSANQYQILKFISNSSSEIANVINISPNYFINIFNCESLSIKDIVFDKKKNIFITGYANNNFELWGKKYRISQSGYCDVFVAKINYQTYRLDFLILIPGINDDKAYSITIDKKNNLYICGYFTDSITFGTTYLHNTISIDKQLFVAKFNIKMGEWIWAKQAGCRECNSKAKFIRFAGDKIYLCGIFFDKISFNNNPLNIIESEGKNLFWAKLDANDGEWEIFKYKLFNRQKVINFHIKKNNIFLYYIDYSEYKNNDNTKNNAKNIYNFLYFNLINTEKLDYEIVGRQNENILIDYCNKGKEIIGFKENLYIYREINTRDYFVIVDNKILKIIEFTGIISDFCFDHQQNIILIGHNDDKLIIDGFMLNKSANFICKINNSGRALYLDQILTQNCIFNSKTRIKKYDEFFYIINSNSIIKYHEDDRHLNCLTIVKSSGIHYFGDYIDLEINGRINTGFNNLKPGYEYYIQEDGNIDIISNNFYYGTAISNGEIII